MHATEENQAANTSRKSDNMISSFINKRISYILLFYFSTFTAQKLSVTNNTGEPIIIKTDNKISVLKNKEKIELADVKNGISFSNAKNLNRFINLFLKPTEKLDIAMESNYMFLYSGDQASNHEYINEKLNIETFGKIKNYLDATEKKNFSELRNASEITLNNILKNIDQVSIFPSKGDLDGVKKMKSYVKYNWLNTVLSAINTQKDKDFSQLALRYYFKQYIEPDIPTYVCNDSYHYKVLEIIARNKSSLNIQLPSYQIIEKTDEDKVNQFLPKSCQKFYFSNKYNYLKHINSPQKDYYKKILDEKFNN